MNHLKKLVEWFNYSKSKVPKSNLTNTRMSSKLNYPSADRNKTPILEVLQRHFSTKTQGKVLELASGTGQHSSYFAGFFPNLTFQPSEVAESLFDSIKAYADDTPTKNVKHPILIDTSSEHGWGLEERFDYIICVNMIHVSPIECTIGLFRNGSKVLKPGGLIVTYGAYSYKGVIEPQSNIDFDINIRREHPDWGLRDIVVLEGIAGKHGIILAHKYDLPSNNKCLIWEKTR